MKVLKVPDAFEYFVTFEDGSLQGEVLELIEAKKQREREAYELIQKGFKEIDAKYAVWFLSIDRRVVDEYVSTETSNGWINILSENDTLITEKNEDISKNVARDSKYELDRFVFAKFDGENYQFIGVVRK